MLTIHLAAVAHSSCTIVPIKVCVGTAFLSSSMTVAESNGQRSHTNSIREGMICHSDDGLGKG